MQPTQSQFWSVLILAFQDALRTAADLAYPWVLGLLGLLLLLELTRVCWEIAVHNTHPAMLASYAVRFACLVYCIPRFEYLFTSATTLGVTLGLKVTGNRITMANFLAPGAYLEQGARIGQVLYEQWNKSALATLTDIVFSPAMTMTYFLAWLVFLIAFFLMALIIFMVQIEAAFALPALLVLTPFLAHKKTAWIGEGAITYIAKLSYKFFMLALIASVVYPVVETIILSQEPDIRQALLMAFAAITFACCFMFGPMMARNMMSGVFTLGAGSLAQAGLFATHAAMVGGGMVAGGARRAYNLAGSVAHEVSGGRIALPTIAPMASRGQMMQSLRDGARLGGHE